MSDDIEDGEVIDSDGDRDKPNQAGLVTLLFLVCCTLFLLFLENNALSC